MNGGQHRTQWEQVALPSKDQNAPAAAGKTVRVSVSGAVLAWAAGRSGREEELHRQFPKLNVWLAGTESPTLRQLEEFSRATLVPFGYFFLETPPSEDVDIADFRVRNREEVQLGAELYALISTLRLRQAWLREFREQEGIEPLSFIGSYPLDARTDIVAENMHHTLHLSNDWASSLASWGDALATLTRHAEQAGVLVVFNSVLGNNTHRRLKPEEFSGFVLADHYAPLIFVNAADGKAAQMFTLAHELAHLWFGASGISLLSEREPAGSDIERACNRVAAAFLMPADDFQAAWREVAQTAGWVETLARRFKVSRPAVIWRAVELGNIPRSEAEALHASIKSQPEESVSTGQGGGDFYRLQLRRLGRPLIEAIVRAVGEGLLPYHEAEELLDLRGKAFKRLSDLVLTGQH